MRRLVTLAALLALAGCGSPAPAGLSGPGAATFRAAAASELSTRLKRLHGDVFALYDADGDDAWTPDDFDLPEQRFLNLFRNEDADDDRVVTRGEFYTEAEHLDLVEYVKARAGVTTSTLGGRASVDNAFEIFDTYLAPYLNKDDRKKLVKKAFASADADENDYLKTAELEVAYAIVLAKAEEKRIEKAVNRSKGQPGARISLDPPAWVKKKSRRKPG